MFIFTVPLPQHAYHCAYGEAVAHVGKLAVICKASCRLKHSLTYAQKLLLVMYNCSIAFISLALKIEHFVSYFSLCCLFYTCCLWCFKGTLQLVLLFVIYSIMHFLWCTLLRKKSGSFRNKYYLFFNNKPSYLSIVAQPCDKSVQLPWDPKHQEPYVQADNAIKRSKK